MLGSGIFSLIALTVIIQSTSARNLQNEAHSQASKKQGRVIPHLLDLTCSYAPDTPQYCYSFNLSRRPAYTTDANDCAWSYCIEALFPSLKESISPANQTQARQKLTTPTCDDNPYCYLCCDDGVCQDTEFCEAEYSVLEHWVGILI